MLKITDLVVSYGAIEALHGISLEVGEGEIVAIIGSNGAGKSTLLNTISGLLRPKSGTIINNDIPLHKTDPNKIVGLGISQVPEGRRIFSNLTVRENLEMGAILPENWKTFDKNLERVHKLFPRLQERDAQTGGTLSGGEQQMLAIGRALMGNPKLLLLDEPSLGLAPIFVSKIFEVIQEIKKEGVTVLLVEQNAHLALQVSHRGHILETGRMANHDESHRLLNNEEVREAYLG